MKSFVNDLYEYDYAGKQAKTKKRAATMKKLISKQQ